MKKLNMLVIALLFTACGRTDDTTKVSALMGDQEGAFITIPQQTAREKDSDIIFRDLFAWHLAREGYTDSEILQATFLAPPEYKKEPTTTDPTKFFDQLTERFSQVRPSSWYDYGVQNPPHPRAPSHLTTDKPITIVIIPGIFGEFIKKFPFHEIVTNKNSSYYRQWGRQIAQVEDHVFSSYLYREERRSLGDLIKIGSYDIAGKPWVNVVLIVPFKGSCETMGTLDFAIPAYVRRLDKFFQVVGNDSDLYLMGYSRGHDVALEMASTLTNQRGTHPWIDRLKGVIGLGGVYYGSKMAQLTLTSNVNLPATKTMNVMRNLRDNLRDESTNSNLLQAQLENVANMAANTRLWFDTFKTLYDLGSTPPSTNTIVAAYTAETKLRTAETTLQKPGLQGNIEMLIDFAFKTFRLENPTQYWHNVRVVKFLLTKGLEGIKTLTTDERLVWWQTHKLPADLRLFSITASMPDAYRDNQLSKMFTMKFYGQQMVDFNSTLRGGFYDLYANEKTEMNDSQVTWFNSRFWPGAFAEVKNHHYYLGIMGTHHWGMAFPNAVYNKDNSVNSFPRAPLMATVASFIYELDKDTGIPD